MKQLKNIKKSKLMAIIVITLLLIAGLIIVLTRGFNVELANREHKQIQLYLNKEFNEKDIKQITKEVFGEQEVIIQKVSVYGDTLLISSNEITEEQKANLVTKINEKYKTELVSEKQSIQVVPKTRIRDILKQYITTFIAATVLILIYMAIKYRKFKSIKVILKTLFTLLISESILFAIIAITRIPVGKITVSMIFAVYILAIGILTNKFENKLQKIKLEEVKKQK